MTGKKSEEKDELFQDVTLAKTVSEANVKPESPAASSGQEDQQAKPAPNESIEQWALVVDDSPTVLTVLTGILKSVNIGTHAHRSATSALKFIKDAPEAELKKITMVLSDFQMPEMTGLDFLREIRNDARLKHLPFVVISGIVERPLLAQFASLGVVGYVVKPFKAQAILDRIMQIEVARQKQAQGQ